MRLDKIHQSDSERQAYELEDANAKIEATNQALSELQVVAKTHKDVSREMSAKLDDITNLTANNDPSIVVEAVNEVVKAVKSIPKVEIPKPEKFPEFPTIPEFPKEMEVSLKGVSMLTIKGDKGEKGDKGDRGEKGDSIEGKQGIKGEKGDQGKDGKDGKNGLKGDRGERGDDGKNGLDGSPDTPDEIIGKVNNSALFIDQERVFGLSSLFREVERFGSYPKGGGGGGGGTSSDSSGWLLNGNTNGIEKYIGTNDAYDFPIYTNGTEKARIKTDGKMGIGLNNPSTLLELYDNTFPSTLPYITDNGVALTLNNTIGTSVVTSHYSTAGGSNSSVLDFLPDPAQFPNIGLRFVGYPIIGVRDSFLELFSEPGSYSILEGVLGDGLFLTTETGAGTAPVIIGVDRIPQVYFNPTNVHFLPHGTSAGNTYEIRLRELTVNGTNYTAFKASDSLAQSTTYVLPSTDPTVGQVLSSTAPSSGVATLSWVNAGAASGAWLLDGNTVGSEKWIGTIDNFAFPVRVNNVEVWSFETDSSIFRDGGLYSISSATTVSWGPSAGSAVNNTNTESVLLGYFAGASSTSTGLVIISSDTNNPSFATTYGNATVAIGNGALALSTNGFNVGVGVGAGLYTTTGTGNVYLGYNADGSAILGNATGSNNFVSGQYGVVGGNFSSVFSAQGIGTASNQIVFGGGNAVVFYTSLNVAYSSGGAKHSEYYRTSTPESAQVGTMGDIAYVNTGAVGQVFIKATGSATNTGWLELSTGGGTVTGTGAADQVTFWTGTSSVDGDDDFKWANATDTFTVSTGGNRTLRIDPNFRVYNIGDQDFSNNGTWLNIDDDNGLFNFHNNNSVSFEVGSAFTTMYPWSVSAGGTHGIRFKELTANGTNSIGFSGPDARTSNTDLQIILPANDPTAGQSMVFSAPSGNRSTATWASIPTGSGGGANQVAYWSSTTALTSEAAFAYDPSTNTLSADIIQANTSFVPDANDGASLGTTALQFSDLFLAEGGVINWDNGDATLTQVGDVLTLAGADLKVTTPGNASTSVLTTDGTQTVTDKSIVATQLTGTAYTLAANNTNATAAYTLIPFEDHPLATYAGTFTWNSTPPTTIVSQQYAWNRIGGTVFLTIGVLYTSAGTTNTTVAWTLPSDCPDPAVIATSGDAANEYMYTGTGRVEGSTTGSPTAVRVGMRRNAANNGFEINMVFGSTSALHMLCSITYRTS